MNPTTTPQTSENHAIEGVITRELEHYQIVVSSDGGIKGKDYREAHALQIATLKAQAEALPPITNTDSYEANKSFRNQVLVRTRTGIDKFRKAMFEDVRRLKAEVDEYLGTTSDAGLQGQILAIEDAIRAKEQVWEAEKERARQEALRIIEERTKARVQVLKDAGMAFDGSAWVLSVGEHRAEIFQTEVRSLNDDRWQEFVAAMEPIRAIIREVEARTQRIRAELIALGMHEDDVTGHLVIACGPDRLQVTSEELDAAIDDRVEQLKAEAIRIVECERRRKQEQAEEDARRQAEFERQRKEREELDKAQAELEAERKRIAEERAELERQKAEEAARREREDRDAIFKQRFPALQAIDECGLYLVADGEWDLHGERVTWHQIVTATDDGFAAILQRFQEAEERHRGVGAGPDPVGEALLEDQEAPAEYDDLPVTGGLITQDQAAQPSAAEPITEAQMMRNMATALEDERQMASFRAVSAPSAIARKTWARVADRLDELISNLRGTADNDL